MEMIWLRLHREPDPLWSLIDAAVIIAVGIFVGHAGVIFWFEKLLKERRRNTEQTRGRDNLEHD